ncbi:hypothetical protein HY838_00705 [Candidatus Azambacteria bacterium]|nr:hypothetical protein [Candidatus Azambacteria bacterium]
MSKKTLYIILVILASLAIIGGVVWYLFFKSAKPVTTPGAGFAAPGQEAAAGWKPISDDPVVSARWSGDEILFYDFSGQLWQFKTGDAKPILTDQTAIENPAEIIWSLNGKNMVKAGSEQFDSRYVFNDFAKKISANLTANIKSAAFSPDGAKMVYHISGNSNINSLYTSNPDGKKQKSLITSFKLRDIKLSWPKNNTISLTSKPSGLITGNAWTLNTVNLVLAKIIGDLRGLETLWAPNGDSFIYSYADESGRNPSLAVYKKGVSRIIENTSTLIDKCAWAGDSINIYCAVPQSWPYSAVLLPDDYYKKVFSTVDDLIKINVETGEKNIIYQAIGDISDLNISSDGGSLIFLSRNSGLLYQLNLK